MTAKTKPRELTDAGREQSAALENKQRLLIECIELIEANIKTENTAIKIKLIEISKFHSDKQLQLLKDAITTILRNPFTDRVNQLINYIDNFHQVVYRDGYELIKTAVHIGKMRGQHFQSEVNAALNMFNHEKYHNFVNDLHLFLQKIQHEDLSILKSSLQRTIVFLSRLAESGIDIDDKLTELHSLIKAATQDNTSRHDLSAFVNRFAINFARSSISTEDLSTRVNKVIAEQKINSLDLRTVATTANLQNDVIELLENINTNDRLLATEIAITASSANQLNSHPGKNSPEADVLINTPQASEADSAVVSLITTEFGKFSQIGIDNFLPLPDLKNNNEIVEAYSPTADALVSVLQQLEFSRELIATLQSSIHNYRVAESETLTRLNLGVTARYEFYKQRMIMMQNLILTALFYFKEGVNLEIASTDIFNFLAFELQEGLANIVKFMHQVKSADDVEITLDPAITLLTLREDSHLGMRKLPVLLADNYQQMPHWARPALEIATQFGLIDLSTYTVRPEWQDIYDAMMAIAIRQKHLGLSMRNKVYMQNLLARLIDSKEITTGKSSHQTLPVEINTINEMIAIAQLQPAILNRLREKNILTYDPTNKVYRLAGNQYTMQEAIIAAVRLASEDFRVKIYTGHFDEALNTGNVNELVEFIDQRQSALIIDALKAVVKSGVISGVRDWANSIMSDAKNRLNLNAS